MLQMGGPIAGPIYSALTRRGGFGIVIPDQVLSKKGRRSHNHYAPPWEEGCGLASAATSRMIELFGTL